MVLALLDAGEKVVVLDDLSSGFRWAVPAGARFVRGDFGDPILVAALIEEHGVEAVAYGVPGLTANSLIRAASRYVPIEGALLLK